MRDNDGDFLLIEAANFLQSWANPENTENRVSFGTFFSIFVKNIHTNAMN